MSAQALQGVTAVTARYRALQPPSLYHPRNTCNAVTGWCGELVS